MGQDSSTTFFLEFLPADTGDADPALISGIGNDVATLLREHGETVQPVYDGQKGAVGLLLEIVNSVWANKDILLSDLSSLVTLLTPVVLIAQHIRHAYEKRAGKEIAQQHPVTVKLEVKGVTLTLEAPDEMDAKAVATQLAQQLLAQPSPADEQAQLPTPVRLKARIPKRPERKRR